MIDRVKAIRSVRSAFEKVDSEIKLFHYKIRNYQGHIPVRFERGHFLVKTAEGREELEEALRLRFDVFHKEYMRKKRDTGVDVDWHDVSCDHLMIIDKRIGRVVGTYRLNSSLFTDQFYSESEFEIENLKKLPGTKLELGRACISREYRTGTVIALLWRGIADYIRLTRAQVIFGCSSIKTMDPMEIGRLTRALTLSGDLKTDYGVRPTKKYRLRQLPMILSYLEQERESTTPEIPALFQSYLRMGAKICGEPALDRDFFCIDFLTLIKADEIDPRISDRFGL